MYIFRKLGFLIALIALLFLIGCATYTVNKKVIVKAPAHGCEIYENNVISANERGGYFDTKIKKLPNDKCELEFKTITNNSETEGGITRILDRIKMQGKKPLIFIHGGLNDFNEGLERVTTTVDSILEESDYYPLFLIWPSGIDTYFDSLNNYLQGEWDRPVDRIAVPFKFATDLLLIPARLPINYASNYKLASNSSFYLEKNSPPFNNFLRSFHSLFLFAEEEEKKDVPYITNDPCFSKRYFKEGFYCLDINKEDVDSFYYKQLWSRILFTPVKFITIPIADPLSRRAWDSMYARIRFTFRTPCSADKSGIGNCKPGIFKQFFYKLRDYTMDQSIDNVTLIGHSMGTIVAGEIIREFPEIPYENVVFSGAAISIREFKNTVESTLLRKLKEMQNYTHFLNEREAFGEELSLQTKNKKIESIIKDNDAAIIKLKLLIEQTRPFRFFNLSLHPFAEAREENGWGTVPSGSLLEWIDNMIENPLDGLDRTMGKWTNIVPLLPSEGSKDNYFNNDLLNNCYMHFSRFGLNSIQPTMHAHLGNKDDKFKFWIPENWRLNNHQFQKAECNSQG